MTVRHAQGPSLWRMRDFRELRVWRAAHELTLRVYRVSRSFPAAERYGVVSQIRRAASSIAANVAEGTGRHTDADAARCFQIAVGSACELLCHVLIARDLGYLDGATAGELEQDCESVRRMLLRFVVVVRSAARQR